MMVKKRTGASASRALVQRLVQGAESGNLSVIQEILATDLSVNCQDGLGRGPLFCAARCGHVHVVEWLLRAGAKVDLVNHVGTSPMAIAAESGQEAVVDTLLGASAELNLANKFGDTAFDMAIRCGQGGVVRVLLKRGVDANAVRRGGPSPLQWAVKLNRPEVVAALLEGAADPDAAKGRSGSTPLHEAALDLQQATVAALLQAGADPTLVDATGRTAQHLASADRLWHGHVTLGAAIKETLQRHEEAHQHQFLLQLSLQRALSPPWCELTFRTMSGNVAAQLSWDMTQPLAGLSRCVRDAIRNSGFEMPFQPLWAGHLRIVLPNSVLLPTRLGTQTLEQLLPQEQPPQQEEKQLPTKSKGRRRTRRGPS